MTQTQIQYLIGRYQIQNPVIFKDVACSAGSLEWPARNTFCFYLNDIPVIVSGFDTRKKMDGKIEVTISCYDTTHIFDSYNEVVELLDQYKLKSE